jgi:carbamoyl-phosphate synthase large subunit
MKSVGEVMAIGRNFAEALQKACQSLENNRTGLGADMKEWIRTSDDMLDRLEQVSEDRVLPPQRRAATGSSRKRPSRN